MIDRPSETGSVPPQQRRNLRGSLRAALCAAAALAACAGPAPTAPDPGAVQGTSCCNSLSDLPYRTLATGRHLDLTIGSDAPSFDFEGGRSRFVAFRLPEARPLLVDLVSEQVAGPGFVEDFFAEVWGTPPGRQWAFFPQLLLLDRQFQVVRTVQPPRDALACGLLGMGQVAVRLHFALDEPAREVAYAVLKSREGVSELLSGPGCQPKLVSFAPVGRLRLGVEALDLGGERIVLDVASRWAPNERDPRSARRLAGADLAGFDEAGRLLLGERRLHYYEPRPAGLEHRLSLPVDGIASLATDGRTLLVGAAPAPGSALEWHAFHPVDDGFVTALRERLRTDAIVEPISFTLPPWPFEIEFRRTQDGTAARRIGEAASTGGIVAALPCGICMAGVCGPELLAPCAAVYAVGAALGGAFAAGKELLDTMSRPAGAAPAGAIDAARRSAGSPLRTALAGAFDRDALAACLAEAVAEVPGGVWRDQGWTAALPGSWATAPAATHATRRVEVSVAGFALVSEGAPAPGVPASEEPARLVVDATVRLAPPAGGGEQQQELGWQSAPRTLAQWGAADAQALGDTLGEACRDLAGQVVRATEAMWRRH